MKKIIGFSGKKQSGKTTALLFLEKKLKAKAVYSGAEYWPFLDVVNFADKLKEIVISCFIPLEWGWHLSNLQEEECKNAILPCGKTVRQMLQIVGTDWFRSEYSDCWIEAYKKRIEYKNRVLTGDVRFPNEVKCIQNWGGHVIRLSRAPFPEDKHESETALDDMEEHTVLGSDLTKWHPQIAVPSTDKFVGKDVFDAVIDNREMTIEQQNEAVWTLVNEKGWI